MFDTFLTRRWSKAKSTAIVLGIYLLLICYVDIFYFDTKDKIFNNYIAIACLVIYRDKLINKLGTILLVRILCYAFESLILAGTIAQANFELTEIFLSSLLLILSRCVLLIPLFIFIRKFRNGYTVRGMIEKLSIKQSIAYSLMFLILFPLTQITILKTFKYQNITNLILLTVLALAVMEFITMAYICLKKIFENRMINSQRFALSKQLVYQTEHNKRIDESINETKKIRHDMKSKLITALYNVQLGNLERATNDLETLLHKVVKSTPRFFSENTAADAVFRHYHALASERGITMKINAILPDREFMPPDDLGLILSHSCENAIEACEGLKNSLIEINTYVHKNSFWFYSIRNSVKEKVEIVDGEIFTTKEDKTSHGFGLPGIRAAVEKYGGVLTMDSDDHSFSLEISLKVPDKIYEEIR